MVCRVTTFAFEGVEANPVDVQVQLLNGMPSFVVVGLPDKAVGESRERVRAAFASLGLSLPPKRIVVNLAPADLPKEGSHYDLAIALALLAAIGAVPADFLHGVAAMGELSLDGRLEPTTGALPAALSAEAMDLTLICPKANGEEAAWAGGHVLATPSLIALINHVSGTQVLSPVKPGEVKALPTGPDLRDVKGQELAKRALEIAAAGGHNLLFRGPPGSGKSMLAQRLPGILPELDARELLDVSQIQSIAGTLERGQLSRRRPFRAPHHSASMAAMVGGGIKARPGEVSLAHQGVLFLDELPEFPSQVLESLRQPLESGEAMISRANRHVRYPARFQLVAAMNPCRCGGGEGQCRRFPQCQIDYQSRLSGPFLDRIDLFVDVPPVTAMDLTLPPPVEGSADVAARVAAARHIQSARFGETAHDEGRRPVNADADMPSIERTMALDPDGQDLLTRAATSFRLSARAYHRVLKVARTIADLDRSDAVQRQHLAEALTYRWRPVTQETGASLPAH